MLIDLLLIASIVTMIFESGWWDEMDEMINKHFKFCHLPKIFVCQFCQCFWISLIWLLFTAELSLYLPFLALITANVSEILLPVFKLLKQSILKVIEWVMFKIY
jgi:hypothetical protein